MSAAFEALEFKERRGAQTSKYGMYIITTRMATFEWIFICTKYIHKLTHKNIYLTKMAYLPSRKNLANESLRNCDVR